MNEHLSNSQIYLQATTTTITTLMPPAASQKLLPERTFRSTPKGLSGMLSSSRKRAAEDQVDGRPSRARLFEIPDFGSPSSSLALHKEAQNTKPFSVSSPPQGKKTDQGLPFSSTVNEFASVAHQSAQSQPPSSLSSILSKGAKPVIRPSQQHFTGFSSEEGFEHKGMHLARRRAIQPPPPMTPVSNPRSSPQSYVVKKQDSHRLTDQLSPEYEDRFPLSEDGYMHSGKGDGQAGSAPFSLRRDHEGFPVGLFDEDEDDEFMRFGAEHLLMSQDRKDRVYEEVYRGDLAEEDMELDEGRHGFRRKTRLEHMSDEGRYGDDADTESAYRGRPVFSSDDHRSFNSLRPSSRSFDPTASHETNHQTNRHHTGTPIDPAVSLLGQLVQLKGGKISEAYEKLKERYAQESLSAEQWEARGKELGAQFNVLAQKIVHHTRERLEIHRTATEKLEAHGLILSNRSTALESIQRGLAGKASSLLNGS